MGVGVFLHVFRLPDQTGCQQKKWINEICLVDDERPFLIIAAVWLIRTLTKFWSMNQIVALLQVFRVLVTLRCCLGGQNCSMLGAQLCPFIRCHRNVQLNQGILLTLLKSANSCVSFY